MIAKPARLFFWASVAFLLIALLFGGATRKEVVTSGYVGLAAIPLLLASIWRLRVQPPRREERLPFLIIAGLLLVGLIQLIPLPQGLWATLPGHGAIAAEQAAAGVVQSWKPISLSPQATLSSLLALLPGLAMFFAALTLDGAARRKLGLVALAVGVVSVVLGGLQIAGGADSPLRFYAITNPASALGFFSNRNHQASLLICLIALAAAEATREASRPPVRKLHLFAYLGLVGLFVAGVGMTQSRAGLVLLAPAALGGVAMAWRAGVGKIRTRTLVSVLGGGLAAGAIVVSITFGSVFARFHDGFNSELRVQAFRGIVDGAVGYAPFGAGLGAFVPGYKMIEQASVIQNTYVNHAHDDWLEVLFEGGLPAALVLALFLVWYFRASLSAWRAGSTGGTGARTGSLLIALLLLHAFVDYALRTPAMMSLFALACAMMIPPRRPIGAPGA